MRPLPIEILQRRSQLLNRLRQEFTDHDYWEVETPLLSHDTCVDRWLNPFELMIDSQRCFLQTSPEFAMKRLLCRGADSIFQICKAFRAGESGANHNPEFTMVEWYSTQQTLVEQITFVERLVTRLLEFATLAGWRSGERKLSYQRLTYEAAFQRFAGLSAMQSSLQELHQVAQQYGWTGIEVDSDSRDDLLNYILATVVEPQLAKLGVVSITDYPATQAALARIRNDEFSVAERFEMYIDGVEICNGYQELTDPGELRLRMKQENRKRASHGEALFPTSSFLVEEMKEHGLPDCSGVALGFDRLAMLILNQHLLSDVIAFPFDKA